MQSCFLWVRVVCNPLLSGLCNRKSDRPTSDCISACLVGCFLHRNCNFLFDAVCFITLSGATFRFAVSCLSAVETLSLKSFSLRGLRCRRCCWFSCCVGRWGRGGDRVKWLYRCLVRGILLVLVFAHQIRFDFLRGTLLFVGHCEFLLNFNWKLSKQEHLDYSVGLIAEGLLRSLLQAFEEIAKCFCSGVVARLIPLVTGHFLEVLFREFFPEQV